MVPTVRTVAVPAASSLRPGAWTMIFPCISVNAKEARAKTPLAPLVYTIPTYSSHPEQEAQQSADAQHDELARAAPANPSAITPTNRIALILFMEFSFTNKWLMLSR